MFRCTWELEFCCGIWCVVEMTLLHESTCYVGNLFRFLEMTQLHGIVSSNAMETASWFRFCVTHVCPVLVTFLLMLSFIYEWVQITWLAALMNLWKMATQLSIWPVSMAIRPVSRSVTSYLYLLLLTINLSVIITYGYSFPVQLLLERGANLEAKDEDGAIPLHDASAGGRQ